MGRDQAAGSTGAAALILAALLVAARAGADPIFDVPVAGRARWGGGEKDVALMAFLADVRAIGVLGGDRLATWPDRAIGTEPGRPQLIAARPGILVDFTRIPLTLVARIDFGEAARPRLDTSIGPLSGAVVDDAYVLLRPSRAAEIVAGRSRVPFARARQREEIEEPFGAPTFLVDRVAPDRRWGVGLHGDLGTLAYFAGAYEDVDVLEQRLRLDDPSRGGAVAFAAVAQWTPSRPVSDWIVAGAGALARVREDGSARLDAALAGRVAWRALSAEGEALAAADGELQLGGHLQLLAAPTWRLSFGARAEWDGGARAWSTAGMVGWNVTRDHRNRVLLVGWLRRETERGTPFDGIVVYLQASL